MTITVKFLNKQTGRPEVYLDKPAFDKFTLGITSDSASPLRLTELKVKFPVSPVSIFAIVDIGKITASSPWTAKAGGPWLSLTPTGSIELSSSSPLAVELSGITSSKTAATHDDVTAEVAGTTVSTKIFLMRYPQGAADLHQFMDAALIRDEIFVTPPNSEKIENVIILRLTNKKQIAPLVSNWSGTPPTLQASFVYGNDIGSLTPADPTSNDPHSAFNIKFDVQATYKEDAKTFEWSVTPPAPGLTDTAPIWKLQPTNVNTQVLGAGSGANVEFRISNISTSAPVGSTQMYLQYSDFPGYDEGYFTLSLEKKNPKPAIQYFFVDPPVIKKGDQVTLSWSTFDVASVTLSYPEDNEITKQLDAGNNQVTNQITLFPSKDTIYTLVANDSDGDPIKTSETQKAVTVIQPPPPPPEITDFGATIDTSTGKFKLHLHWTTNALITKHCEVTGDTVEQKANVDRNNPYPVKLSADRPLKSRYTLTAYGTIHSKPAYKTVTLTSWKEILPRINVGRRPQSVCVTPDGNRLFVANSDGTVTPIQIGVAPPRVDAAIETDISIASVCVTPDGSRLFVASDSLPGKIMPLEIDVSPPKVGAVINVALRPLAVCVTPDGTQLFVLTDAGVTPIEIGVSPPRVGARIGPDGQNAMCVTPDGRRLFVADSDELTPIEIGVSPPRVGAAIRLGAESMCVTPDGSRLFAANPWRLTITPIEIGISPPRVDAEIKLYGQPKSMCVTPDGTWLFVYALYSAVVFPIEIGVEKANDPGGIDYFSPPRVGAAIKVGRGPGSVCMTPDGTWLFVANYSDQNVSVICPSLFSQTPS